MRFHRPLVTTIAVALAAACTTSPPAVRESVLPFIEDDYAQALETARARQLPLFVEAWAPW